MAVSESDVRHVASLARLGLDEAHVPALVRELNGILDHMEDLSRVETEDLSRVETDGEQGSGAVETTVAAIRPDTGGTSVPLSIPREQLAPDMRDGFFLVPRLGTHEGDGERSP